MLTTTTYSYAGFEIESGIDEEGACYVSIPTIETLFGLRRNSAREILCSKQLEDARSIGLQVGKTQKLSSDKGHGNRTWLDTKSFLSFLNFLAFEKQNEKAKSIIFAGFVADFVSTQKAQHGIAMEEEEQEYLRILIFERLQRFKGWTNIIDQRYREFYGEKPPGKYYAKLVKRANLHLFGVPDFGSNRTKNMTTEQQETIKDFEKMLARTASKHRNKEPEALLDLVIGMF